MGNVDCIVLNDHLCFAPRNDGSEIYSQMNSHHISTNSNSVYDIQKFEYMSIEEMNGIIEKEQNLKIDYRIDYRIDTGKFIEATIVNKNNTTLTIQFENDEEELEEVECDYKTNISRFAQYGSISKRKAHRFISLIQEDYIDINRNGWRFGEINEFDDKSGQILVGFLDDEEEYEEYWTHLDNEQEVAECGSKCDILEMIKQNNYDPYFNIKKHKYDGKLMNKKLVQCFEYINTVLKEKKDESQSSLIQYLIDVYRGLYKESIISEMNDRLNGEDMKCIKDIFIDNYKTIIKEFRIDIDRFHLEFNVNSVIIDTGTDKTTYDPLALKLREIKVRWNTLRPKHDNIIDDDCDEKRCRAIKRVNYILELFDEFYIDENKDIDNNNNDKVNIDFMEIYNKCVSSQYNLDDDFDHLQQKHLQNILHSRYLIDKCICNNREKCKIATIHSEDNDFGYNNMNEINIMRCIVKMHMTFQHKEILKIREITVNYNDRGDDGDKKDNNNNHENDMKLKYNTPVTETQMQMHKFQFGERFYYTKYYQDNKMRYIAAPKWNNLKEELLSNQIYELDISIFAQQLFRAANISLSAKARTLKSKLYGMDNDIMELPAELPITISHLLCVILYTNMTKLQYNFKKYGCRMSDRAETVSELRTLNQEIGWWYKLFSEAVLFYGSDTNPKHDVFYHGLSAKLLFSSFNPDFQTPISTTVNKNVAQQFADGGIILILRASCSSSDRYLNVQWMSDFPKEEERVFIFAHNLYIYDILFKEKDITYRNSNRFNISAMRLFDYIFNVNCGYHKELFQKETQAALVKLLMPFMDVLTKFIQENDLKELNKIIEEEEYDTDCVQYDLSDNNSSVLSSILNDKFEDELINFTSMIKKYHSIPKYLCDLFGFIMGRLNKKENINMIKSEYNKLENDLKNVLNELLYKYNIKYTQEFEWKIENDEFKQFMELSPQTIDGTEYEGPQMSFKEMLFNPVITRIDPSMPNKCSFGIQIQPESIPSHDSNTFSFHWSFAVKEIYWSFAIESFIRDASAIEDDYDGKIAFENKELNDLNCLTFTIYMR